MDALPVSPSLRPVSGGYLSAVGARISGHDLNPLDSGSPPAILISQSTARIFGPGRQIGRFVDWHFKDRVIQLQVVGVVSDLRNTVAEREPFPEVFIDYRNVLKVSQQLGEGPLWQHERALGLLSFAVRTRGKPAAVVPAVTHLVRDVDPNAGIDAIVPLEQLVSSSVARPRFYAVLLGAFAGVAGVLAAIGIYGVLAYAVTQRTQEIGIRMALGARRRQVLMPVLFRGLLLTIVGVAAGLAAASVGTRLLQGMLFGVMPLDRATFVTVSLLFGIVAAVASYLPARRATKVDPMIALRHE
jgi:putative ABC transport system permease protein